MLAVVDTDLVLRRLPTIQSYIAYKLSAGPVGSALISTAAIHCGSDELSGILRTKIPEAPGRDPHRISNASSAYSAVIFASRAILPKRSNSVLASASSSAADELFGVNPARSNFSFTSGSARASTKA